MCRDQDGRGERKDANHTFFEELQQTSGDVTVLRRQRFQAVLPAGVCSATMPYIPQPAAISAWNPQQRMRRRRSRGLVRLRAFVRWAVRNFVDFFERWLAPASVIVDLPVGPTCIHRTPSVLMLCTCCRLPFRRRSDQPWMYAIRRGRVFHFCERCWPVGHNDGLLQLRINRNCQRALQSELN